MARYLSTHAYYKQSEREAGMFDYSFEEADLLASYRDAIRSSYEWYRKRGRF